MYFIRKIVYLIREKAKLNQYALDVKNGNLEKFDEIDKVIRPNVRKMTYRHTFDPHTREDMEQAMMEFTIQLCKRYEAAVGNFENYCLRSVYFELMNYWKRNFEQTKNEVFHEGVLESRRDEMAEYRTYGNLILEDFKGNFYKSVPLSEFESEVHAYIEKGFSVREIASQFKRSEKSIKNTVYRINQKKLKSWVY
ncbi:LuxR C-terminal-related transcriptional regulator [Phocicoccus pinnipedialis]|uniref:RNA polymerase factor sigma-70 n=2 Tax=Phocicoccus pinnipedialis TaxID=110845 RepID=A0A6V7R4R0_9BACL|nr:LuxR C-terminal-related transcriptional regulator [Jeotgalicoccus pinnipedialis]MBP1940064.1 RNA polymerase sporulation-specific sigma factor [Jeotgalicoccus pinnipedialis]CAD2071988.1 RNA polymerase factor sigma-70 [Jeotgalicoccus pinnipedialis]